MLFKTLAERGVTARGGIEEQAGRCGLRVRGAMSGRSSGSSWSGVRATARATGRMSKIEKVKPWPASLPVEMGKVGLDLCAPFSTKWYNDYVAEAHLKLGLLEKFGRSEGALAYVLGSSKALWERFLRHTKPRSAFPDHPRSSAGGTASTARTAWW